MSQHIDGTEGRWVPDPDDPEFEVWEELGPRTTPEAAAEWDAMLAKNDGARCVAHKKSGERCRRLAIQGATVCRTHGGASGHVRRAARARLEMAADRMAKELLKIAVSDDAPDNVKLAAIKDALDRAGLSAKTAVEVSVDPKPFEEVLGAIMSGGTRAASRAERGVADDEDADAAWIAEELAASNVIDAEVVEPAPRPRPREEPAITDGTRDTGLMDMESALEALRQVSPPPAPTAKRRGRTR